MEGVSGGAGSDAFFLFSPPTAMSPLADLASRQPQQLAGGDWCFFEDAGEEEEEEEEEWKTQKAQARQQTAVAPAAIRTRAPSMRMRTSRSRGRRRRRKKRRSGCRGRVWTASHHTEEEARVLSFGLGGDEMGNEHGARGVGGWFTSFPFRIEEDEQRMDTMPLMNGLGLGLGTVTVDAIAGSAAFGSGKSSNSALWSRVTS